MVSEQTGVLDTEATGGIVGRNMEQRGASTPLVPLDRQIRQEVEVEESQLPPPGT